MQHDEETKKHLEKMLKSLSSRAVNTLRSNKTQQVFGHDDLYRTMHRIGRKAEFEKADALHANKVERDKEERKRIQDDMLSNRNFLKDMTEYTERPIPEEPKPFVPTVLPPKPPVGFKDHFKGFLSDIKDSFKDSFGSAEKTVTPKGEV